MNTDFKPCVVIPVYNHEDTVGAVTRATLMYNIPCILVNDGSSPACRDALRAITAHHRGHVLLAEHETNQGKGAAVITGLRTAAANGLTHALQIDADGQHDTADIPKFIERAKENPNAVIAGCPIYDKSVPKARLYGRYATHVWVWINTLSFQIKDSMCGFRMYPIAPTINLINRYPIGARMDFDTDIIVRLFWEGVPVENLPTAVRYHSDAVSHFDVLSDNLRISKMHAKHFGGMLIRLPQLIARHFSRNVARQKK